MHPAWTRRPLPLSSSGSSSESGPPLEVLTSSPLQTEGLGGALVAVLPPGAIVYLVGEIGAGKTTFVRGAARGLGITEPITSPTFTIANRYAGDRELAHIDAWRLVSPDSEDLAAVLASFGEEALVFIEWPDQLADALPAAAVRVEFEHRSPSERLVRFWPDRSPIRSAITRLIADSRARYGSPESEPGDPGGG